jgi:hypothetical protein
LNIISNIILPFSLRSSKWSLSLTLFQQNPIRISPLRCTCHMPRPFFFVLFFVTQTVFYEYRSQSFSLFGLLSTPVFPRPCFYWKHSLYFNGPLNAFYCLVEAHVENFRYLYIYRIWTYQWTSKFIIACFWNGLLSSTDSRSFEFVSCRVDCLT